MNYEMFNEKGYRLHVINTNKFKTAQIHIRFLAPLERDTVTMRSLIPYVLKAGTDKYRSKKEINKQLDMMYGASLNVGVTKYGRGHVINFRMSLANENYLEGSNDLFAKAVELLSDLIYKPYIENESFVEKIVEEEKRLLVDEFDSIYDDKIRYGIIKLVENMCDGENFTIRAVGLREDVDKINSKELYDYYRQVLSNDIIDIMVIGDVDAMKTKKVFADNFDFSGRENKFDIIDHENRDIQTVRYFHEKQNINQGKLNIGFRTNIRRTDELFFPMVVANGILGAFPHSLLFRNVREKHSLCYYVASRLDNTKGLLFVYSGIEIEDYQKALDIIREQIEMLKKGEFDDEIIDMTKRAMTNDIQELQDSLGGVVEYYYITGLSHKVFSVEEYLNNIQNVTREQIIQAAKNIKEDTVFYLSGEVSQDE